MKVDRKIRVGLVSCVKTRDIRERIAETPFLFDLERPISSDQKW